MTMASESRIFFHEFELLSQSDLFDPAFYLETNPDIAALNVDPLMHYLESGGRERRNPSANFDTSHYLKQCDSLGEVPSNPLSHYLMIGFSKGLTPKPSTNALLYVDVPGVVGGRAVEPVRGNLSLIGWAAADAGIESIDILLDGARVISARHGLRRPDVAAAHPSLDGAMLSGYAAHLPSKALPIGSHLITVSARDRLGSVTKSEFRIEVETAAEDRGPWALRRKMSQAELNLKSAVFRDLPREPQFHILLALSARADEHARVRRTLRSVARQSYSNWRLSVQLPGGHSKNPSKAERILASLLVHLDEAVDKVAVFDELDVNALAAGKLILSLAPGDELSCDALLEFALASVRDPKADLLYCDDRRLAPTQKLTEAFFKPAWSPDLLLSMNYIGRAWCATTEVLKRSGLSSVDLAQLDSYETVLRATEAAARIHHVPKVLMQHSPDVSISGSRGRDAITAAIKRRKIAADVVIGPAEGHFRVKRKVKSERVSVIIPTCATDDLVKVCLNTLRDTTSYKNYEVICIENIPKARKDSRKWLTEHADIVIRAADPFNWSCFNNRAAERASGKYLLFLNDDIECIDPDWLSALVEQVQRPEVGVVGPLLLYPDRTIQHAGMMLDDMGRGRHAFRHLSESDGGYFGLALTQRNVIAVTGACLFTRRETFESLGRFDEAHSIINNDLDYCLKSWKSGLLNVYTPHSRLIHHELVSRASLPEKFDTQKFQTAWRKAAVNGDPYFNPNLSRQHEALSIDREPVETIHAGHPIFARSQIRRILVAKLDHIGDCITALPAIRLLKLHFPQARISTLAATGTASIWRSEPAISDFIAFDFFHARSALGKIDIPEDQRRELSIRLAERNFDLALDLRKQPDTRDVLQWTGANILAGFDHQGRFPWLDVALEWDEDVPLRTKRSHISDELIALVSVVISQSDTDRAAFLSTPTTQMPLSRKEKQLLAAKAYVCIHPAAGTKMRQWPADRFAELIEVIVERNGCNAVLVGSRGDKEIADAVQGRIVLEHNLLNLAGRLNLEGLKLLLAGSILFIGNNSGPQHIAAALGVPTIGIHSGVVDAREWAPLGPTAMAIRRGMSCSPCYLERAADCPRGVACLSQLEVVDVYRACETLLTASTAKRSPIDSIRLVSNYRRR